MTLELLEGAVDALSAYVQTNMPAKVVELNARYGDEHTLEDIKLYYDFSLPLSTPETPSMAFHAEGLTPGDQRLANIMVSSYITVVIFLADDDPAKRARKLSRYALGVVELLGAAKTALEYIVKLRGPATLTDSMNTQPFLQGIMVPVSLSRAETY